MLFLQQKGDFVEHFKLLKATKVFKDATEFECQAMMYCLKTKFKTFDKHNIIINQGDDIQDVVLILKGSAIVENTDALGNISVVKKLKPGDVYGIESAYAVEQFFRDSVIATEKTFVMFMNKHRLITPCENKCPRHEFIVRNLMKIVADGANELLDKITHMSKKTIRDKLLSYFTLMSKKAESEYFEIPFNKTELASYLAVDRSAMSTELSKLRDEGIIDFDKKEYRLITSNLDDLI